MKRPICVFAIKNDLIQQKVEKDFADSGMRAVFVKSEQELESFQEHPETFANFVDLRGFPQAIHLFRGRDSGTQHSFWAVLTQTSTKSQIQSLFNMGFADVLTAPVHPVTFKSRARLFLTRYMRNFEMPEDVVLPPGITRLNSLASRESLAKEDSHTHRVHDLTPEQMQTAWNIHTSQNGRGPKIQSAWRARCADPQQSPIVTGIFGAKRIDATRLRHHERACEELAKQPYLFVPIDRQHDKYFREAVHSNARTVIWSSGGWVENIQVKNCDMSVPNVKFSYPEKLSAEAFGDALNNKNQQEQFFLSLFLSRARVFFSQNVQDYDFFAQDFTVKIPNLIYLVQRRGSFRFVIPDSSRLRFRLKTEWEVQVDAWALNVSSTGVLLRVPAAIVDKLIPNQSRMRLFFEIYGKKIECSARVVRKVADANSDFANVGVHFLDIEAIDQDGLQLFVMEESYPYTSKFT